MIKLSLPIVIIEELARRAKAGDAKSIEILQGVASDCDTKPSNREFVRKTLDQIKGEKK